jgi:hypothetical protein
VRGGLVVLALDVLALAQRDRVAPAEGEDRGLGRERGREQQERRGAAAGSGGRWHGGASTFGHARNLP